MLIPFDLPDIDLFQPIRNESISCNHFKMAYLPESLTLTIHMGNWIRDVGVLRLTTPDSKFLENSCDPS